MRICRTFHYLCFGLFRNAFYRAARFYCRLPNADPRTRPPTHSALRPPPTTALTATATGECPVQQMLLPPSAQLINKFQRRQNKTFFICLSAEHGCRSSSVVVCRHVLWEYFINFDASPETEPLNLCTSRSLPLPLYIARTLPLPLYIDRYIGHCSNIFTCYFGAIFTLRATRARRLPLIRLIDFWSTALCHLVGTFPIFQQLHAPATHLLLLFWSVLLLFLFSYCYWVFFAYMTRLASCALRF